MWTLDSATAWKTSMTSNIADGRMLLSSSVLQLLNNIESNRVCASFYRHPCTTIVSYNSLTNTSDKTNIITSTKSFHLLSNTFPNSVF